jgi:hypothetical protein
MNISRVVGCFPAESSPIVLSIIISFQLVIDSACYLKEVCIFIFALIKYIKVEERHQESCNVHNWDQILNCRLELSCKPCFVSANKDKAGVVREEEDLSR